MWYDEGLSPLSDHSIRTFGVTIAVAAVAGALAYACNLLPDAVALGVVILLMLGATWTACRFALPHSDRLALGKMGRTLRLV
ncbi:hypothetical protein [Tsuneonella deserti]|nr:hypothetical protein [Tsuneonella deserti]